MSYMNTKRYPATAIANAFLEIAHEEGDAVSPMKLLKLVYYAHGWHLALTDSPLLDEQIEAWDYGPVVGSLWGEMRKYSGSAVDKPIGRKRIPKSDVFIRSLIKRVWEAYGEFGAMKLSNLTHMPGTPWHQVYEKYDGDIPRRKDIENEEIRAYFKQILKAA